LVKITYIEDNGDSMTVEAEPGLSVMKAATNNGVPGIVAECGGNCACGTCRIYVDEAWSAKLAPPEESEQQMLEFSEDTHPGVRLSCQIPVTEELDGMEVRLPPSQY